MDELKYTYIIIGVGIIIIIALLAQFGVLETDKGYIPERCAFPVQLQCDGNYKISENEIFPSNTDITFTLTNGLGEDITINGGVISANSDTLIGSCNIDLQPGGDFVANTEKIRLKVTNCPAPKIIESLKKKYRVLIKYNINGTNHSMEGEILAKREKT